MSDTAAVFSPVTINNLPPPTWFPQDGPCPYCKALGQKDATTGSRLCDDCHKPIPVYPSMGGSGYESATVGHFHLGKINALDARLPVMRELCRECYIVDYVKMFGVDPGLAPLATE